MLPLSNFDQGNCPNSGGNSCPHLLPKTGLAAGNLLVSHYLALRTKFNLVRDCSARTIDSVVIVQISCTCPTDRQSRFVG